MKRLNITKNVLINVDGGFDKHKEILRLVNNSVSCTRYEPTLELTHQNELGTTRYMKLTYNKHKQLQRVSYWDVNPEYKSDECFYTAHLISLGDVNIYIRSFWKRLLSNGIGVL